MYSRNSRRLWLAGLMLTAVCVSGCQTGESDEDADAGPDVSEDAGILGDAGDVGADAGTDDAGQEPPPSTVYPGWTIEDGESTDEACKNNKDDDGSGYLDCADYWCLDTVTVQVCSALENTDALCSDGTDNSEKPHGKSYFDGLADCADPDCLKNPRVTVCAHLNPLKWETAATCASGEDSDKDGLSGCEDPDCWTAENGCPLNGRVRVLFDDAHRERAGSADWVVDSSGRLPWPSVPKRETDWSGNLSAFGKALFDTGRFTIETLPSFSRLTYGDDSSPQDLKNYGVLVIPEPSARMSEAESRAVVAFVRAGGGLLMVADHLESDRDGNGWDSVQVFNDMLMAAVSSGDASQGAGEESAPNPFGFNVAPIGYSESGRLEQINRKMASTIPDGAASHPVLSGPHGNVTKVGMFKGGLFSILDGTKAKALIHAVPLNTAGYEEGSPFVVAAEVGQGRVVAVGDSAILNDGTDSHGQSDPSFDSWNSTSAQNSILFLNAAEWLAKKNETAE